MWTIVEKLSILNACEAPDYVTKKVHNKWNEFWQEIMATSQTDKTNRYNTKF